MTLELSVVTYGNGDILREVFNAIAPAMNTSGSNYHTRRNGEESSCSHLSEREAAFSHKEVIEIASPCPG